MKDPATVLVTAIGGIGVGEQIVKALRLAGGYRIVGADINSEIAQSSLVDEMVTLPAANEPEYVDALLAAADHFSASAVFCGSEAELRVLSRERRQIHDAGLFLPLNPATVIDTCMDKAATNRFLTSLSFPTPKSLVASELESLDVVDYFPVVVKPMLESGGSRDVFIAQSVRELRSIFEFLPARSLIVQEYVGRPDSEYTVGVLHDMDGVFVNSIAMHRRLTGLLNVRHSVPNSTDRDDLGPELVISSGISHGYLDTFPEVTGTCEEIAQALGAHGPINIQCRVVDGDVYVFEINPRFSGTTSIRAMMGYNEPHLLIRRHLLGETIQERFPYEKGLVLRSLTETILPEGKDHQALMRNRP